MAVDMLALKTLDKTPVWILGETRLQTLALERQIRDESLKGVYALTTGDALWRLAKVLLPFKSVALGHEVLPDGWEKKLKLNPLQSQSVLLNLVERSAEGYPKLVQYLSKNSADGAKQVLALFDALRLNEANEQLFKLMLDEFGNTKEDAAQGEELIRLFDAYVEYQREELRFDYEGIKELLANTLLIPFPKAAAEERQFPATIVLDQPTYFFPLEKTLWQRAAAALELHLSADELVLKNLPKLKSYFIPPSFRYAVNLGEFIMESEKQLTAIHAVPATSSVPGGELLSAIFDGGNVFYTEVSNQKDVGEVQTSVVECAEARDEVNLLVQQISSLLQNSAVTADECHVVCLGLDSYSQLLEFAFESAKIPLVIPKGNALASYQSVSGCLAFLSALGRPTFESIGTLLSHSSRSAPLSKKEDLDDFQEQFNSQLQEISNSVLLDRTKSEVTIPLGLRFSSERLSSELRRLGLSGGVEVNDAWGEDFLRCTLTKCIDLQNVLKRKGGAGIQISSRRLQERKELLLQVLADVAIVWSCARKLKKFATVDSVPEFAAALRKEFYRGRNHEINVAAKKDSLQRKQSLADSKAFRRLRQLISSIAKNFEFAGSLPQAVAVTSAAEFASSLQTQISETRLLPKVIGGSVFVTELLDVRGLKNKHTFILGANSDKFPASGDRETDFGSLLSNLRKGLFLRQGWQGRVFESYWMLGHILRHSRQVTISFSQQSVERELQPAGFVKELLRGKFAKQAALPLREEEENFNPSAISRRSLQLINARQSASFSAYDGFIGAEAAEKILAAQNGGMYSVSSLEALQDCALHYFFRDVLKLSPLDESIDELVRREAGVLIHETLRVFLQEHSRNEFKLQTPKGFSLACELVQKAALSCFAASEINWDKLIAFKQVKDSILAGLDDPSSEGKRGVLKAAIVYERDLIQGRPKFLEYGFGLGENSTPALKVASPFGEFGVKGQIDRIDIVTAGKTDSGFALWDYKTGQSPSVQQIVKRESLQLPLYAAAVRQNLEPNELPTRAGYLVLASANMDEAAARDVRKGVLRPLLGLAEKGTEEKAEFIAERVENALELTRSLHERVVNGEFQSQVDAERCDYCDFRRVCARNEALLALKQADGEESPNVDTDSTVLNVLPEKLDLRLEKAVVEKRTLQLSSEQLEASNIGRSISLNAGAGSGKTAVLQTRVVALILSGVSPFSILAITFTEKAAAEIRSRIESTLQDVLRSNEFLGRTLEEKERRAALNALAALSDVQLSTIHALCVKLLAMRSTESDIVSGERVMDAALQAQLIKDAVAGTLSLAHRSSSSANYAALWKLLSAGIAYGSLSANLESLLFDRRNTLRLARSLGIPGNEEAAAEKLLTLFQNELVSLEDSIDTKLDSFLQSWSKAFTHWSSSPAKPLTELQQELVQALTAKVVELQAMVRSKNEKRFWAASELHEFLADKRNPLGTVTKTNPRNYWNELRDFLLELNLDVVTLGLSADEEGVRLAQSVITLACAANEAYRMLKEEGGVADFDDLIFAAREMLCGNALAPAERHALLGRVRNRFTHIMVDEFQDTDELQWDIIKAISGVGELSSQLSETRTLFIVGDAQQAIYSFRGGDVRVFRRASDDSLKSGATNLSLSDNYRSNSGVLEFVNKFFSQLFAVDFDESGRTVYGVQAQRMNARREYPSELNNSVIALLGGKYQRDKDSDEEVLSEAERIASFVAGVIAEPARWPQLSGSDDGPKIAILCRTVTQLMKVKEALELRRVQFSISHSAGFYELDEIQQLENLLKVIANPRDIIALAGFLRSSLFGFSDKELLEVGMELDFKWENLLLTEISPNPLINEVRDYIQWLQQLAEKSPTSAMLEVMLRENQIQSVYKAAGREESYRNIERFVDKLRAAELEGSVGTTPNEVVAWIQIQRHRGSAAPNANNSNHPVVLMTVHGAKGLEYSMVILPFLRGRQRSPYDFLIGELPDELPYLGIKVEDEEQNFKRSRTLAMRMLSNSMRAQACSEERRIFYVACTRAKDYLVLSFDVSAEQLRRMKSKQTIPASARNEALRESMHGADWLLHSVEFDNPEEPTAFLLNDVESGESIKIPIL